MIQGMASTSCQSCSAECIEILDLGSQPICNRFLSSRKDFATEKLYPLKLMFCPKCTLVQLSEVLPLKTVFGKDFNYLTGSYPEAVAHFRNLANTLIRRFKLKKRDVVLDIGGNDGTFLENFKVKGIDVLNIEPTPQPAKIAMWHGVLTINKPFENSVDEIEELAGKKLKLITALNVLAHTDRIHDFLEGVRTLGAPFVSQSGYLPQMIRKADYSRIYHEHSRFYSVTSLRNLFSQHGLRLFDAEETPYLGGSFLAYATSGTPRFATHSLKAMLASEQEYAELKTYEEFARTVYRNREALQNILIEVKAAGKSIAGVGAPMSMSPLTCYAKIGADWVDYTTELNPLKIGTFSPGVHIPVRAESRIFEHKPDFLLLFAWQVSERIIRSFKERGFSGEFIVPFPEPRIVR